MLQFFKKQWTLLYDRNAYRIMLAFKNLLV